jgi:hypothetical protein
VWRRDEPENRYNTPNRASNEPGNPKTNRCSTSNGVLVGERRGCDTDRLTLLAHPSGSELPSDGHTVEIQPARWRRE